MPSEIIETTLTENAGILGDNDDSSTDLGINELNSADELDDVSVSSADSDESDNSEGDEVPDESRFFTTEDNPEYHKHWRNAKFNESTSKFDFCDDDRGDNGRGVNDSYPKVEQWLKVPPRDMSKAYVTFNGGRETLMSNLIQEYDALHRKLDDMGVEKSQDGLFEHIFGEDQLLATTMCRTLKLSYTELCQFLATVYFAAEFGLPAHRLEKHTSVDYKGFMKQARYNQIWNDIADAGKKGDGNKFWQDMELAINTMCNKLFLDPEFRAAILRIALDDDKVHIHWATSMVRDDSNYLCGMKPCQHVEANCRGITVDSAVLPASGFPLQFSVLRAGETNTDSYIRMVKSMFNHAFTKAESMHQALHNTIFCSDRGYWNETLIAELLSYGAIVFGTLMRMWWVPYTYAQQKLRGRVSIDPKFGRSCFQAFVRFGEYMLKVMAWRSGTGAVSLAMNSRVLTNREPQTFDFCIKNNGDAVWYKDPEFSQEDRNLRALPVGKIIKEKHPESLMDDIKFHLKCLFLEKVTMLTVSTLCQIWFTLRMFSFTSSSAHSALRYAAPLIDSDDEIHSSFSDVLDYAGLSSTLSTNATDLEDDSPEIAEDGISEDVMTAAFVKSTMISMMEPNDGDADDYEDKLGCIVEGVGKIEQQLRRRSTLQSATLIPMLVALGIFRERAEKLAESNPKPLLDWIKSIKQFASHHEQDPSSKYKFPYDKILNAKEAEAELRDRVGVDALSGGSDMVHPPNPKTKNQRIDALEYLDEHYPNYRRSNQSGGSNNHQSDIYHAVINGTVARSFLRAREGAEKKEARLGHQNEKPYLRQFYKDSRDGHVPGVSLVDVRLCGLAMKNGAPYVRDSADALAFEKQDLLNEGDDDFDVIKSHPIECKCRSGRGFGGSLNRAESIQQKIVHLGGLEYERRVQRGEAVYWQVSSSQRSLLKDLIPNASELVQIIHHGYTWGNDKTTFLVGGPNGKLLYGVIVTFEPDLLENYGKVLKYLYENGLKIFYEDDIKDLPLEYIESVLLNDEKLKKKYTLDDFMTALLIWRELIPTNSTSQKFPIPECNMLVPLDYSQWNSSKGGSDTVTRFTYNCQCIVPIKSPQSVVVARFIMLYAVLFHRMAQSVTGTKKPDLVEDTVTRVRNRNNRRLPFYSSLNYLANRLRERSNAAPEEEQGDSARVTFLQQPAPRFTKARQQTRHDIDHRVLGAAGTTGATPVGRGATKNSKKRGLIHEAYDKRRQKCRGHPMRIANYKEKKSRNDKDKIDYQNRKCDLCGKRVAWMCFGCKQVLCFDSDRTEHIKSLIENDERYNKMMKLAPELEKCKPHVPAYWRETGTLKDEKVFTAMSCFHYCHSQYFNGPQLNEESSSEEEEEDDLDDYMSSLAETSSSSPNTS